VDWWSGVEVFCFAVLNVGEDAESGLDGGDALRPDEVRKASYIVGALAQSVGIVGGRCFWSAHRI